jgi:hypothetical protein
VTVHPAAEQFAAPNQPGLSASDARTADELYRLLIFAETQSLETTRPCHALLHQLK